MHTKKTEQDWKNIITDWQNSGISQTAYIAKHGLSSSAFWVWKKKFVGTTGQNRKIYGKATTNPNVPAFVQFAAINTGKIEICLNGSGAKVCIDKNDKEGLCTVLETLMLIEHKGK